MQGKWPLPSNKMKKTGIALTLVLLAGGFTWVVGVWAVQPRDDDMRLVKVRAQGETVAELRVLKRARLQIESRKLTIRKSPKGDVTTITSSDGVSFGLSLGHGTDINIRAEEVEVNFPLVASDFK